MTDSVVDIQHLDAIKFKFTELGAALSDLSSQNTASFDSLLASMQDGFKGTIKELAADEKLGGGKQVLGVGEAYVANVSSQFEKIGGQLGKSVDSLEKTLTEAEKGLESVSKDARGLVDDAGKSDKGDGEGEDGAAGGAGSHRKKGSGTKAAKAGLAERVVVKELKTLKSRIGSMWSKLKLPKLGAVAAGGLGIMIYGYMDRDRVRYQAGEMKNILIAAYDDGVKGAVGKGTRHLSAIQERMQRFMGINRKEIQGAAQAFVDGGASVDQMTQGVDVKLKGVAASAVTTTLALDKMFELPGGESAKRMVQLMATYGKNAEESRESLTRMYMVGRESGIGTMQFVKNVESAAGELGKMGYDIDKVVDIYSHVTERFAKMGVPKQFAGKQAAMGIQQLAGGIAKMSDGWKVIIGERLGYGSGIEARQKMMDAFLRVAKGNSTDEVLKIVEAAYNIAMEATGGDEESSRFYMEKQMGLGFEGARLVMQIGKDVKEGKTVEAAKAAKKNMKDLSKAFGVESTKRSKFELMMNSWKKGMAKIGQGILGIVIQTVSWLLAYFKALPTLLVNALTPGNDDNSQIVEQIDQMFGNNAEHKRKMFAGIDQMIAAADNMSSDVLGSSLRTLRSAWNFDPSKGMSGRDEGGGGGGAPRKAGPSLGTPTSAGVGISPVATEAQRRGSGFKVPQGATTVPVFTEDRKYLRPKGSGPRNAAAGAVADDGVGWPLGRAWAGAGVSLSMDGVDSQGNMSFSVGGDCPRCGLVFKSQGSTSMEKHSLAGEFTSMNLHAQSGRGGTWTGEDVEALGRVIQTEIGGYDPSRHNEAVGIAHTLMNRGRGWKGQGTLARRATSGHGWGRQTGDKKYNRQFGSRRKPNKATQNFAREILSGKHKDWTGGATGFIHANAGRGVPPFMKKVGLQMMPSGSNTYRKVIFAGGNAKKGSVDDKDVRGFLKRSPKEQRKLDQKKIVEVT